MWFVRTKYCFGVGSWGVRIEIIENGFRFAWESLVYGSLGTLKTLGTLRISGTLRTIGNIKHIRDIKDIRSIKDIGGHLGT